MNAKNLDIKNIPGHSQRKGIASKWYLLVIIVLAIAYLLMYTNAFGLMPRLVRAMRERSRIRSEENNKAQIASAIKAYESTYDHTASRKDIEFVRQRLLDAVRGEDLNEIVSSLYQDHAGAIKKNWLQIRIAPESLVQDKSQAVSYALAIMALATYFKEQGDASLLKQLEANSDASP